MEIQWAFALAAFAGFIRHIQRYAGEERPAFAYGPCAIAVLTGGFVGILALWIVRKHFSDPGYIYVAIAIAGYGGPLTLDALWAGFRDYALQLVTRAAQKPPNDEPKN